MKRGEKQRCKNPVNSMADDRPMDTMTAVSYVNIHMLTDVEAPEVCRLRKGKNRGLVLYHYPHISTSIYLSVYLLKNHRHTFARRRIGNLSHKTVGRMRVMAITSRLLVSHSLRFEAKGVRESFSAGAVFDTDSL